MTFIYNTSQTIVSTTIKSQIYLNSGDLIFQSIAVPQLHTPFLSLSSGIVTIQDVKITDLQCRADDESITYCLFNLDSSPTPSGNVINLIVNNLALSKVVTFFPLIYASAANLSVNNVQVDDVQSNANVMFAYFITTKVLITHTTLLNMSSSVSSTFIQSVQGSIVHISDSVFDNTAQTNTPTFPATIQFVVQRNGQITVESTQFKNNSAFFPESGGVLID